MTESATFFTVERKTILGSTYYMHIEIDSFEALGQWVEAIEAADFFSVEPEALPFETAQPTAPARPAPSAPPQRPQQRPTGRPPQRNGQMRDPDGAASDPQKKRIFALRPQGWSSDDVKSWVYDRYAVGIDDLTKGQASEAGDLIGKA